MKKSFKQNILSRVLVSSSLLVLAGPTMTQSLSAIPISADTTNTSITSTSIDGESNITNSSAGAQAEGNSTSIEANISEGTNESVQNSSEDEVAKTGTKESSETADTKITSGSETIETEPTERTDEGQATTKVSASKDTATSTSSSTEVTEEKGNKVAAATVVNASSSDVKLLNKGAEQAKDTTLGAYEAWYMGASGDFTVKTSDLVSGNKIVIATVNQTTTDSTGAMVSMEGGFGGAGGTLYDTKTGVEIGNIGFDPGSKEIYLKVTNTVQSDADSQLYSFSFPSLMSINYNTSLDVRKKMPFSNTFSIGNNSYTFNFNKIPGSHDATTVNTTNSVNATVNSAGGSVYSTERSVLFPDNASLLGLQGSHGQVGNVVENNGVMNSLSISDSQDITKVNNYAYYELGIFYVSASSVKIQALETSTSVLDQRVIRSLVPINKGNDKDLSELQTLAKSEGTGIYYSRQGDGSYLVVEYVTPMDMILTDDEIEKAVRSSRLSASSSDVDADVQATLDYYHGIIQNRSHYVTFNVNFDTVDQYSEHTLTAENLTDSGSVEKTVSAGPSKPNAIASGTTPVKIHYIDLNGQELTTVTTKAGAPTNKANDLGAFSSAKATVEPKDIPAYSLVTDVNKLTPAQRAQLETTNSALLNYASTENAWDDLVIFATKSGEVPYPGFADRSYDSSGKIVPDGTLGSVKGYGQTDVYYFYVGDPQKVVYNVIDDTDGKTLEANATFDNGTSNENLNKGQADLQAIADGYLPKGYEIVSVDPVPGVFNNESAVDQVVNIHLKHATETNTETKEVKQTIHYVYEDGKEAAPDEVDTVSFTRTTTKDLVTNTTSSSSWQAKDNDTTFDAVSSPTIDNYTADKAIVNEVTGLTQNDKDTEVTVTYKANTSTTVESKDVRQTIHYVYEDSKEAAPDKVDTVSFTRTVTTNEATGERSYGKWQAKDNDTTFDAVTSPAIDNYTADKTIVDEVSGLTGDSKNKEIKVTYSPKTEITTESKEVNRVIHYVYEDGTEAANDATDKVIFIREATKNLVTGEVTYSDWKAKDNDTTFDKVTSPNLKGYTADLKLVEEVTDLKVTTKDLEVTVTYVKDKNTTPSTSTPTKASPTTSGKEDNTVPVGTTKKTGKVNTSPVEKIVKKFMNLPTTGDKVGATVTIIGVVVIAGVALLGALKLRRQTKDNKD